MASKNENEKQEEVEELSPLEVWSILEYAKSLSSGMYLTPDLVSSRMKDINLNPMVADKHSLEKAMSSPKDNEEALQAFSQDFELQSMVYKRLLSYLSGILAFDLTYTSNAKATDYTTPKYKKDLLAIDNFISNFDYKREFAVVVREMLRNDAYFGCMREIDGTWLLQELPSKYCKITGRWAHGFLFSFNMEWFLLPGVYVDMYPEFFRKKYRELFTGKNKKYDPSLSIHLRGNSSFDSWVDVPVDIGVCFKLNQELATRLPYFTPMFNDLIMQSMMRNLQKNANMAAASKMIIGEVPMLNKDTKATVKDSIGISPALLGKFLALVKSGLSEAIQVASAPLENMQAVSFDETPNIYDSYLRTTLASSGVNSNLIFSSNIKPNVIETQLSLDVDEQLMSSTYGQFNGFMNYHVGRITKNFKFYFSFEGTAFFTNRKERYDRAMALFREGIVLPQKIGAAMGMKPFELTKQMEEAKGLGFMSLITPPLVETQKQTAKIQQSMPRQPSSKSAQEGAKTTQETEEVSRGRPQKSDGELSDEGAQSRAQGTNIARGGEV